MAKKDFNPCCCTYTCKCYEQWQAEQEEEPTIYVVLKHTLHEGNEIRYVGLDKQQAFKMTMGPNERRTWYEIQSWYKGEEGERLF